MLYFCPLSFLIYIAMQLGNKHTNLGLMALRVSLGLSFVIIGWGKLNGLEGTSGMLEGLGFPAAGFFAWVLALTEFLGGLALIFGVYIRLAAKLLAIAMLVALFAVHVPGPFKEAMSAFTFLGSSLAIMFLGGGDWQLMKDKECVGMCKVCK